ncbi:MAG TPA: 30S ribosomal protein S16 [Candidatus Polarisedimenticolia bacterium]|nr:30S ribosomal protein S16 [Candidatus Polarisedimenticolia bacterium]
MLRIRLSRRGASHRPFYRFVVSDSKKRPGATAVDTIGFYDPTKRPAALQFDLASAEAWIKKGAVASPRVEAFIKKARKAAV